jgi:hypothetical protein
LISETTAALLPNTFMPNHSIHHLVHLFLSIDDFANLDLELHFHQYFLCFVPGGCLMVLDCRNAAELVAVDPWLKLSIVFHIHIDITEAFDYNMCLIRCPGSEA